MSDGKIFCIGPNKTGTSSLHAAFETLQLKSVHFRCDRGNIKELIEANHRAGLPLLSGIDDFDAYSDWNMPHTNLLFRDLDEQYPGSRFILNTRDRDAWLDSREAHVRRTRNLARKRRRDPHSSWLAIDRDEWTREWHELHDAVAEHFRGRDDLLEFDATSGDGWERLCPFIGFDVPDRPFPHSNVTTTDRPRQPTVRQRLVRRFGRRGGDS